MIALVALLLAADPLLLWHAYRGAEEQALAELVERFNRESGLHVETLALPYDALASKLTSAIPTGHGPDVFIFAHERLGGWAREGYVAEARDTSWLSPVARDALTVQGRVWGLPLAYKSVALYTNRALVPKPPETTDELVAIAEKLSGGGRYGIAWPVADFYFHAAWLSGFGGRIFDEPGHKVRLDSDEAVRALEFVRDLSRRFLPEEPTSTLVTQLFNEGKAAMVISGPWFEGEIRGVDARVSVLPVVSQTGLRMRPLLSVEAALVSGFTRNPEGAHRLAAFLAGREAAVVRAVTGRQVVANDAAYDDPRLARDETLAAFRAQAALAIPTDNSPQMGAVWEPEKRALTSVIGSGMEPRAALGQAQRRVLATTREAPPERSPWPWVAALGVALAAGGVVLRRRLRKPEQVTLFRGTARAYAYVAPAFLGMLVLVVVPFAAGMGLSFFHHQEGRYTFVGAQNFIDILASRDYRITEPMSFYFTLAVTMLWTLANVTLHVGVGLGLALLLRDPLLKLKGVYRVLLIVPWAVPNYITALVWKGMFHRQFGAVSALLAAFGIEPISWFTRFSTAFAANVITNTWLGFPFMMVVTLGALQSIPQDLYEAAQVDGASRWQQFKSITLPLLKPALLPAVILGSVWTFNMFNIIYLVSGGEPGGATDILVSEAYRWAFQRNEQFGFAAAYSTLIFVVLLGYSALTRRIAREEPA